MTVTVMSAMAVVMVVMSAMATVAQRPAARAKKMAWPVTPRRKPPLWMSEDAQRPRRAACNRR